MKLPEARALSLTAWLVFLFSTLSVAHAAPRVFALIVTSNRGSNIAQAPLSYADDDGVRYLQLFRAAAVADSDVRLLTRFDDATRTAYPALEQHARTPVLSELSLAIRELAEHVRIARAAGESTVLYFVFAGHGEVLEGRGYLALEDSSIDGDFIEHQMIERIAADTTHVVLDSCNSFFVINPRRPGGRRWATPDDMAFGFSARHPEVGVFLSTNAEEEVFEWSRLESGVFSHEVRSGMRGAADVDSNGDVSYAELAGFVTRANQGIVRESLRPHLFYRAPHDVRDASLFSVAKLRGGRLTFDLGQTRGWLADARGERVLDLHKEPGPLTIVVPAEQGELSLIASTTESPASGSKVYAVRAEHGQLSLREAPAEITARGERMFGELFSQPYGRHAFADFEHTEHTQHTQHTQPRPIFDLSASDAKAVDRSRTDSAPLTRKEERQQQATRNLLFRRRVLLEHPVELRFPIALLATGAAAAAAGAAWLATLPSCADSDASCSDANTKPLTLTLVGATGATVGTVMLIRRLVRRSRDRVELQRLNTMLDALGVTVGLAPWVNRGASSASAGLSARFRF